MEIDGGCHCGFITFRADIDPARVSICHCTDCQQLTGSAYRVTVLTPRADIRIAGGEPKVYVKTGDTGRKRQQLFCPQCGSPLFTCGEDADSGEWGIRWGSIRQRDLLPPTRQIWCQSAATWINDLVKLPGQPTGSSGPW